MGVSAILHHVDGRSATQISAWRLDARVQGCYGVLKRVLIRLTGPNMCVTQMELRPAATEVARPPTAPRGTVTVTRLVTASMRDTEVSK